MGKSWFGIGASPNNSGEFSPGKVARPLIESEARLKDWLDQIEGRLEKMAVAYNLAAYNKYIGRPASDLNQYDAAFSALLHDPANQATVQYWLTRANDPTLQHRLALFQRAVIEAEVSKNQTIYEASNAINERLINFRPQIDHEFFSRSAIAENLRLNPNRARRQQIYEQALRPLAEELEPQVSNLMQRRNAEALRLGYGTYADLHLALLGLERSGLLALFDRLEELTDKPYRDFLEQARRDHNLDRVEPWDLQWLAGQRADLPDRLFPSDRAGQYLNKLVTAFGLNSARLPIEIVQRDIPFGGLCFTIRVPDDIRIICTPKEGYPYYRTMFHEYGHALHSAFNRQPNYFFKREWGAFNEGMAEILAYFTHYDDWLRQITGYEAAQLVHYQRDYSVRRILRIRNLIAQARFEIEAYDNPGADLGRLAAEYEARYLLIPLNLTPRWAAVSFPTTHPIYRQNYLIAELIAAQTHTTIRERFGSFFRLPDEGKAAIFSFLCENYYAPGAAQGWSEKIRQATGQPLKADALLGELGL